MGDKVTTGTTGWKEKISLIRTLIDRRITDPDRIHGVLRCLPWESDEFLDSIVDFEEGTYEGCSRPTIFSGHIDHDFGAIWIEPSGLPWADIVDDIPFELTLRDRVHLIWFFAVWPYLYRAYFLNRYDKDVILCLLPTLYKALKLTFLTCDQVARKGHGCGHGERNGSGIDEIKEWAGKALDSMLGETQAELEDCSNLLCQFWVRVGDLFVRLRGKKLLLSEVRKKWKSFWRSRSLGVEDDGNSWCGFHPFIFAFIPAIRDAFSNGTRDDRFVRCVESLMKDFANCPDELSASHYCSNQFVDSLIIAIKDIRDPAFIPACLTVMRSKWRDAGRGNQRVPSFLRFNSYKIICSRIEDYFRRVACGSSPGTQRLLREIMKGFPEKTKDVSSELLTMLNTGVDEGKECYVKALLSLALQARSKGKLFPGSFDELLYFFLVSKCDMYMTPSVLERVYVNPPADTSEWVGSGWEFSSFGLSDETLEALIGLIPGLYQAATTLEPPESRSSASRAALRKTFVLIKKILDLCGILSGKDRIK